MAATWTTAAGASATLKTAATTSRQQAIRKEKEISNSKHSCAAVNKRGTEEVLESITNLWN
jgi:hypothetical protein